MDRGYRDGELLQPTSSPSTGMMEESLPCMLFQAPVHCGYTLTYAVPSDEPRLQHPVHVVWAERAEREAPVRAGTAAAALCHLH